MADQGNHRGMARRLMWQIALLVASIMISGGALTIWMLTGIINENLQTSLAATSAGYLRDLERNLFFVDETLKNFSKNQLVVNSLVDTAGREFYLPQLAGELSRGHDILDVSVVDFSGNIIFSSSGGRYDHRTHRNFQRTLANGTGYLNYQGGDGQGRNRLVFLQPIEYYRTTQGVVALTVDLADFVKSATRQDKGLYYRLSIDQRPVYSDNFQADNSYVSLRNKDTRHMSYLHELGMTVEIGALKKEYQKPVVQAALRFLGLAVIALVVAVFIAARTGQRIARPIVELCGRVQRTSLAEEARCSPVGTGDELEELALAFDFRNGQLLQIQKELRANNEALEDEISRRQIIEELLQKAHDNLEKRVEERTQELRASQEGLTRAQEIAHLGNWDWLVGEDRLWWSDEIYRIFGLEPQAFAANYEAFLAVVHPADREMVTQVVERAREKGAPFALEHRIVLPSGEERVVLEQGEVVCDEEGVAIRMVGTVLDISVQKELEMLLVKNEERLSSLLALSQRSWSSQEELVEFALEEAVRLTGSEVGYFHLFDESQKEIELYVWSKKTRALCTIAEPLSHYPLAAAGVWADSIRQGQAVIHNDYQDLAAKKGLPEGHFPLRRHLGVPVFDGDAIVAVVGVGNRVQKYNAGSVRQLTLYMNSMWQVLKRKRMEEELQRKNANLAVLYKVTEAVNKSIDLQETLADILEAVTTLDFVKVEQRGVLFLVKDDKLVLAHHLGHPDAICDRFAADHQCLDFATCLCGLAARSGEIVISENSATDPRHTLNYAELPDHGHVILPLKAKEELLGVLCLYIPLGTTIGSKEMELLQALGNQIGTGIDNARVYEKVRSLALHDPLTGLANRRYLELTFTKNLARAQRHGAPFAIIMFDIDYFKKYNDTYGHDAGDEILVNMAQVVSAQLREVDFVARYGGEEFILLLSDTTLSQAGKVAEKVRKLVESTVGVTISLGVSAYDAELVKSQESMISQADKALYCAKGQGRNRVVVA